jgi:hypothetical protein
MAISFIGAPICELCRQAITLGAWSRGFAAVWRSLGFSEGRVVTVEFNPADGHNEGLSALAVDLVRQSPAATDRRDRQVAQPRDQLGPTGRVIAHR